MTEQRRTIVLDRLEVDVMAFSEEVPREVEDAIADAFNEAADLLKVRLRPFDLEILTDF
jgi:hypothetical protein